MISLHPVLFLNLYFLNKKLIVFALLESMRLLGHMDYIYSQGKKNNGKRGKEKKELKKVKKQKPSSEDFVFH